MLRNWIKNNTKNQVKDLCDTSEVSKQSKQVITFSDMDYLFVVLPEDSLEQSVWVDKSHIDGCNMPVDDVANVKEEALR